MKTSKEYPATHSMSTAWFCVDEDGNVGIFDIDDNGPVPINEYKDTEVNEVFWYVFSSSNEKDPIRYLPLTKEQISPMLTPYNERGIWEEESWGSCTNISWSDVFIKIDMSMLDILRRAAEEYKINRGPICVSKELGLFYIDLYSNKEAVDFLESNGVILKKYKAPIYNYPFDEDEEEETKRIQEENEKFPVYIYLQDYWPNIEPAVKLFQPKHPLKINQLPESVRKKIRRLPLKFNSTERVQLAELIAVSGIWTPRIVYHKMVWWELASTDLSKIYYNDTNNTIIKKAEMDKLLASGEAEEWDYDKHKDL